MNNEYFALLKNGRIIKTALEDLSSLDGINGLEALKITKDLYDLAQDKSKFIYRTKINKRDNSFSLTEVSNNPDDPPETFTYKDVATSRDVEILPREHLNLREKLSNDELFLELISLNGLTPPETLPTSIDKRYNLLVR